MLREDRPWFLHTWEELVGDLAIELPKKGLTKQHKKKKKNHDRKNLKSDST
jgi:hypothetical protein